MKRLFLGLLSLALLGLALTGCGLLPAAETGAERAAPLDPLTGRAADYPGQRPAAVMAAGGSEAAQQWGMAQASVVLEALTEGAGQTSLCLVYPALEAVPTVGPVAQGRDLYLQLLSAQQVIPVQRGASLYAANLLDLYSVRALDGHVLGTTAFTYQGSWGTPDQFCWTTSGSLLAQALSSQGINTAVQRSSGSSSEEEEPQLPPLLPFGTPEGGTEGAIRAKVSFAQGEASAFEYDAGTGQYAMYRADGRAQTDAGTGEQVAFDNLLILYSAPTLRDDGYTWSYDLTVGGGVYLSGGKMWNILWMQGKESTLAIYRTDGTALNIAPGRSYIALLGSLSEQKLSVWDSAGNTLAVP